MIGTGSNVLVLGCSFHHSQAVIKCVRKIGRTEAYRDDEDVQAVVRYLLSLSLLRAGDIPQCFAHIKTLLDDDSPILLSRPYEKTRDHDQDRIPSFKLEDMLPAVIFLRPL